MVFKFSRIKYILYIAILCENNCVITQSTGADLSIDETSQGDDNKIAQALIRIRMIEQSLSRRLDTASRLASPEPDTSPDEMLAKAQQLFFREQFSNRDAQIQLINDIIDTKGVAFSYTCLCELISLLAEDNNKELLVELLRRRCPARMGSVCVEDYLIVIDSEKLIDGTLVLCDAFDKSDEDENRHEIYCSLKRGYRFIGLPTDSEVGYVAEVREWYKKNHNAYEPNWAYVGHISRAGHQYVKEGVLKKKGISSNKEPGVFSSPNFE